MPKVLFSRPVLHKLPLNSNEMLAHTPPDNVSIGNCSLTLNPLGSIGDACSNTFYSPFGGGSLATATINLNGFQINDGIQDISGTVGGQAVATWDDETSPVTGNEATALLELIGTMKNSGTSTGGCGRCFSQSRQIEIDGTNIFLLNDPPNPHKILISQTTSVCVNGDSRVESIDFSSNIGVEWHPNINNQSNPFYDWFTVKIEGSKTLAVDANPLIEHTIPVTATYTQYDFSAANSETRTATDIADIPTDVTITLASSA
jgi:hypothetical protein